MSTVPWGAESLHLLPGVGAARVSFNGEPSAPTPGPLGAIDSGKNGKGDRLVFETVAVGIQKAEGTEQPVT